MADDAPETPATPAADTVVEKPAAPDYGERISGMEQTLNQLRDAVTGYMGRPAQQVQPGQGGPSISEQDKAYLRSQGLSDADITSLAPQVRPFVDAALRSVAPEFLGLVGNVADQVEELKASRNSREYPDWEAVGDKVNEIRENARKANTYLTVKQAYDAAVASNFDKVSESRAARKASSAGADLSAQHLRHAGSRAQGKQEPQNAADVRALSKEERKAYFEKHGDSVIH